MLKVPPLTALPRSFYERPPVPVARELLGKVLCRRVGGKLLTGRIVETEAYLASGDDACHASRGKNRKNATMFGPAGMAYVYVIHARHCFNIVTETVGLPSAVLIRALEPCRGIASMTALRGRTDLRDLARGPARLCEALAIDRALDGWDLSRGQKLWVADAPAPDESLIVATPRIGVTSAHHLALRYFLAGSAFVSGSRKANLPAPDQAGTSHVPASTSTRLRCGRRML